MKNKFLRLGVIAALCGAMTACRFRIRYSGGIRLCFRNNNYGFRRSF